MWGSLVSRFVGKGLPTKGDTPLCTPVTMLGRAQGNLPYLQAAQARHSTRAASRFGHPIAIVPALPRRPEPACAGQRCRVTTVATQAQQLTQSHAPARNSGKQQQQSKQALQVQQGTDISARCIHPPTHAEQASHATTHSGCDNHQASKQASKQPSPAHSAQRERNSSCTQHSTGRCATGRQGCATGRT